MLGYGLPTGSLARGRPPCVEPDRDITIGLVNIMPYSAIRTTEHLFRRVLNSFALEHHIHLRLFAPQHFLDRLNEGCAEGAYYESFDALLNADASAPTIDALIVTGTESTASQIEDEPIWPYLQKICDWAADHTVATLWSCFSAHAAVLHLDGIRRHRMAEKRSGVFQCRKAADHLLTKDLPAQFPVPHSRHNGVAEASLRAHHYEILSQAPSAGVDAFTKQYRKSQFLFLQGHPEYSRQTLFGEYSRDVRRFLAGKQPACPSPPDNYFDLGTIKALDAFQALEDRSPEHPFPPEFVRSVMKKLDHSWREPAHQLFANWLRHIASQKYRNRTDHFAYANKP